MIGSEKPKRKLVWDGRSLTGTFDILCMWRDVDPALDPSLPQPGDSWGGRDNPTMATIPFLRVKRVEATEKDGGLCDFHVDFSSDGDMTGGEGIDAFVNESRKPGAHIMPDTTGWLWSDTLTPVIGKLPEPDGDPIQIDMRMATVDDEALADARYRVNDREFRGKAAGTLLFLGADTDRSYGWAGEPLSSRVVYSFLYRKYLPGTLTSGDHRYFWRPPLQKTKIPSGEPRKYQNISAADWDYTADDALVWTPVWADGIYGVGAWACPNWLDGASVTHYIYEECDFATVLGIPG